MNKSLPLAILATLVLGSCNVTNTNSSNSQSGTSSAVTHSAEASVQWKEYNYHDQFKFSYPADIVLEGKNGSDGYEDNFYMEGSNYDPTDLEGPDEDQYSIRVSVLKKPDIICDDQSINRIKDPNSINLRPITVSSYPGYRWGGRGDYMTCIILPDYVIHAGVLDDVNGVVGEKLLNSFVITAAN